MALSPWHMLPGSRRLDYSGAFTRYSGRLAQCRQAKVKTYTNPF